MRVQKNFLITGPPRVGKTTLIQKLAQEFASIRPIGFYTAEITKNGIRQGFELVSLDGRRALLSHAEKSTPHRVGKYYVDVPGLERFLDSLNLLESKSRLIVIDEIARMECLSPKFKTLTMQILDSDTPVLGTIAWQGEGFIAQVKKREDVAIFELTPDNRETTFEKVTTSVRKLLS